MTPHKGRRGVCDAFPGKVRYPTRKRAESVLMSMKDNGRVDHGLVAYACQACDGYHLGNGRRGPKRRRDS